MALVLKVSYGVDVHEDDDPYIDIANDAMYATGNGGAPAGSIVDVFPPGKTETYLPVNRLIHIHSPVFTELVGPRLASQVCT